MNYVASGTPYCINFLSMNQGLKSSSESWFRSLGMKSSLAILIHANKYSANHPNKEEQEGKEEEDEEQ